MSNIYQLECKKFEERYGPAIAQFLCDELEKSDRLSKKNKQDGQNNAFQRKRLIYKAA